MRIPWVVCHAPNSLTPALNRAGPGNTKILLMDFLPKELKREILNLIDCGLGAAHYGPLHIIEIKVYILSSSYILTNKKGDKKIFNSTENDDEQEKVEDLIK